MTATLPTSHHGALYITWRDQDPTVVHLRVFADGGILHNPEPLVADAAPPVPVGHQDPQGPDDVGPLPIRWAPRPLDLLRWRIAHSAMADDLRSHSDLIGVCLGLLLVGLLALHTPLLDVLQYLLEGIAQ